MSKYNIVIESQTQLDSGVYEAHGTIDGEAFLARTIMYNGEPIFKVVEDDQTAVRIEQSSYTRGQRSAIARVCKGVRLGTLNPDGSKTGVASPTQSLRDKVKELEAENAQLKAKIAELEGSECEDQDAE